MSGEESREGNAGAGLAQSPLLANAEKNEMSE